MTLRIHDLYLVAFGVRMAIHLALSFAVNPVTPTSGEDGKEIGNTTMHHCGMQMLICWVSTSTRLHEPRGCQHVDGHRALANPMFIPHLT